MSELQPPARSVIRTVTIDRPAGDVYAFLSDAANWPRWAVVNVLSAEPADEPGWWRIATADGPGEIRIRADAATGVVDHDFRDPDDPGWMATVPARVIANGRGADFVMTIFRPPGLGDEAFDRLLADTETEIATLKEVLETPVSHRRASDDRLDRPLARRVYVSPTRYPILHFVSLPGASRADSVRRHDEQQAPASRALNAQSQATERAPAASSASARWR